MARLEIRLLGQLEVRHDGQPLLANLLWPEADEEHGRANLRKALSLLRKLLGSNGTRWLVCSGGAVRSHSRADDLWLDLEEFEQALTPGPSPVGDLRERGSEARVRALEQAIALYRGPPLTDIYERELAEHCERAQLWEKALVYMLQAARRAQRAYAYREALTLVEKALALFGKLGPRSEESMDRAGRRPERSRTKNSREALEISQKLSDRSITARVLYNIGDLHAQLGEHSQALEHFQRAGELWASLGDGHRRAYALRNSAIIQLFLGEYAQAQENLESALTEFQRVADPRGQATAFNNLGLVFCDLNQWARAQECYERAYQFMSEVGDRRGLGVILLNLGTLQIEQGRYTEALGYLDRVVSMLGEAGLKGLEVGTLLEKGRAHLGLGELHLALECSTRAMQVLEAQHGMISQAHRSYFIHYRILHANGRTDEANRYLHKAYEELCRIAEQIQEETLRQRFLEHIPLNRQILQAFAQHNRSEPREERL